MAGRAEEEAAGPRLWPEGCGARAQISRVYAPGLLTQQVCTHDVATLIPIAMTPSAMSVSTSAHAPMQEQFHWRLSSHRSTCRSKSQIGKRFALPAATPATSSAPAAGPVQQTQITTRKKDVVAPEVSPAHAEGQFKNALTRAPTAARDTGSGCGEGTAPTFKADADAVAHLQRQICQLHVTVLELQQQVCCRSTVVWLAAPL